MTRTKSEFMSQEECKAFLHEHQLQTRAQIRAMKADPTLPSRIQLELKRLPLSPAEFYCVPMADLCPTIVREDGKVLAPFRTRLIGYKFLDYQEAIAWMRNHNLSFQTIRDYQYWLVEQPMLTQQLLPLGPALHYRNKGAKFVAADYYMDALSFEQAANWMRKEGITGHNVYTRAVRGKDPDLYSKAFAAVRSHLPRDWAHYMPKDADETTLRAAYRELFGQTRRLPKAMLEAV